MIKNNIIKIKKEENEVTWQFEAGQFCKVRKQSVKNRKKNHRGGKYQPDQRKFEGHLLFANAVDDQHEKK